MVKRVAVVGAGAAGLAVLRRFTAKKEAFQVACFEQLSNVAGLWNYSDNITDPNHPTGSKYTAIYKYMRTNLPRQVMIFEGCPYPDGLPTYISHTDVKNYLEKYADTFNLRKYIKFDQEVVKVDPKSVLGKQDVWLLKTMDVHTKIENEYEFDIVIVCCGQYSVPYYPLIKGMDDFHGQMIHSQLYKDPEEFQGKRVVVIGGGPSGIDISIEISNHAKTTWLSHRTEKKLAVSKNILQVGEISYLTSDSAFVGKVFDDDNEQNGHTSNTKKQEINELNDTSEDSNSLVKIGPIDVIVLCTGYQYSYPFLSADCGVAVLSPLKIGPLYKDLVCLSRPTLSFIGLLYRIVPFIIFDCQAQFLTALYDGQIPSLSCKDIIENEMKEYDDIKRAYNIDVDKDPFNIPEFQWFYAKHLSSIGNFSPPPHFIEDLVRKVWNDKCDDFLNYKNSVYVLGGDGLYFRN